MNQVRSVRVADPVRQYTTWYAYDHNGRVEDVYTWLSARDKGLGVVDPAYRVAEARPNDPDLHFAYSRRGAVDSLNYPPIGIESTFGCNAGGWRTSVIARRPGVPQGIVFSSALQYDPSGQITGQIWRHGQMFFGLDYGYDAINRLKWWAVGPDTSRYTYDNVGNRQTSSELRNGLTTALTYSYNPLAGPNRLQQTTKWDIAGVHTTDYSYDPNGAVTGRITNLTGGGITRTENFDHSWRGLLRQYTFDRPNVTFEDWRYRYSAAGEREQKRLYLQLPQDHQQSNDNLWVYYLLGGNKEQLAVYHGREPQAPQCEPTPGQVYLYPVEYNTYAGGISRLTTRPDQNDPQGAKEYKISDHIGSTRVVLDEQGTVIGQHDYEPFGQAVTGLSPKQGYIDKERDKESALGDYGVRKYDMETGRFLSVDALWEEYRHYSLFQYAANNVVLFLDFDGKRIYFNDAGGDGIGTEEAFNMAMEYWRQNGVDVSMVEEIMNSETFHIWITGTHALDENEYKAVSSELVWNPIMATEFVESQNQDGVGRISAATALYHELFHAHQYMQSKNRAHSDLWTNDSQYRNLAERKAVEAERHAADMVGESLRYSHKGKGYRAVSTISTQPAPTEKKAKRRR